MGELEKTFLDWRGGSRPGCLRAGEILWKARYGTVLRLLLAQEWPRTAAEDAVNAAFWNAMEELDLGVSGGAVLFQRTAEGDYEGSVSGRKLKDRPGIEWTDEKAFLGFGRLIWYRRAQDLLRRRPPEGHVPGGDEPPDPNLPLDGSPDTLATLIDRRRVLEVIEVVGAVAVSTRERAVRETAELTIAYLKGQIAACNPAWRGKPLQAIYDAPLDELCTGVDLGSVEVDYRGWHDFLRRQLFPKPPDETVKKSDALAWINDAPAAGKPPSGPQKVKAHAREAARSASSVCCPQSNELSDLVRGIVRFKAGPARAAELFAHFDECESCLLGLGAAVIDHRQRNTVDVRIKRFRDEMKRLFPDAAAQVLG